MGQRSLPRELRTKKTNSLPKDLKAIAEELIGEKFGFEEEVVERESYDPFRQDYGETRGISGITELKIGRNPYAINAYLLDSIRRHNRGYLNEIRVREPVGRFGLQAELRISRPSEDHIMRAIRRFDILRFKRHGRKLFVNPWFAREMFMRVKSIEPYHGAVYEGEERVIANIYDVNVVLSRHVEDAILVVDI